MLGIGAKNGSREGLKEIDAAFDSFQLQTPARASAQGKDCPLFPLFPPFRAAYETMGRQTDHRQSAWSSRSRNRGRV
jgi:hypothetical protein